MSTTMIRAAGDSVGSPVLNIAIFAVFVVVTLAVVIKVSTGKKQTRLMM